MFLIESGIFQRKLAIPKSSCIRKGFLPKKEEYDINIHIFAEREELDLKADLHIHTKESDGCLSVEDVLLAAYNCGIKIISITDHDTTRGVEKAQNMINNYGIKIIPGVEFQTNYKEEEIHLLGYYNNIQNDYLQERLKKIRDEKSQITERMVKRLKQNGFDIKWEEVKNEASTEGVVCKTHIMYAIYNKATDPQQLDWNEIASWFKPGGIAYIPYFGNPYEETVDFIYETGGLPVLAHPGLIKNKKIIKELLNYKPIGLEVYYGYWDNTQKLISFFEKLSKTSGLLATGGSDYHGFYSPVGIGEIRIPQKCIIDLKNYLEID